MASVQGIDYNTPPVKYRGERVLALARKLSSAVADLPDYMDERFAATVYYMLYLPYPLLEEPRKGDRRSLAQYMLLSAIQASPRFYRIRKHTIADATTSLVASAVLVEALARSLSQSRPGEGQGGGAGENDGSDVVEELVASEELEHSVERALEAVSEVVQHAKEIANFALSFSAGNASALSLEDSIQEVIALARNTDVRMLLEALKTIEEGGSRIRIRRVRTPRGELDGYEKGDDIERIVASELVLPEILFMAKLAEKSLLLYRKVLGEDYGPFYVLLDKSGSMMGMKMIWAKAVALALAQRAARERREFYLRFFDSTPYPPLHIPKRIHGRDVAKLLEYVARIRANGGTDITKAILTATDDILSSRSRRKPSDIVLITDGEDRIALDAIRRSLQQARARLYTVMIYGNNPDLRKISEAYMVATRLTREEALRVVNVGD